MSFIGCKWGAGVDYMFFRNANTNIDKLDEKLVRPSGPADDVGNFCAYCCQCSWTDVKVYNQLYCMFSANTPLHA